MAYANLEGLGWLAEDMQAWTADHYEPKLRFDSTPVYSVTLAESVEISPSAPYVIDSSALGGAFVELWVVCTLPSALSVNCGGEFTTSGGDALTGLVRTTGTRSACFSAKHGGGRWALSWGGNSAAAGKNMFSVSTAPVFFSGDYSQLRIVPTDAATLPAGTTISVWGAKEV